MESTTHQSFKLLGIAAAASLCAIVLALAFVGWQRFGTEIFLTAIENGLAWCL